MTPEQRIAIETNLKRMKSLAVKIKTLSAEYEMLKKESIDQYFAEHEAYINAKGLELATYKAHQQTAFETTKFKAEHENLYKQFCVIKTVCKFLLK